MKHQATQSIKFLKLKRTLRLVNWQAVGLLESLWHATQANAMDGGIGRFSDDDIAAMIEWQDDPKILIEALINCGWIDRHPDEKIRLAIHDWHVHAPRYIKGIMARGGGKTYVSDVGEQRRKATYVGDVGGQHAGAEEPNLTKPNLTKRGARTPPPDPLVSYPLLAEAFPDILAGILQRHGASTLPDTPEREAEWRHELAAMVRLDGHAEKDVAGALVWCLTEEEEKPDGFSWFKNFRAIPPLRHRKSKDRPRKVEQIIAAWKETQPARDALRVNDAWPKPPEETPEEIERQSEQKRKHREAQAKLEHWEKY